MQHFRRRLAAAPILLTLAFLLLSAGGSAASTESRSLDLPSLLAAGRSVASQSLLRGIPIEDATDAASLLAGDVLRARRENPALVERVTRGLELEMLAAAPASAPVVVGPLLLSRPVMRQALGSRSGRDRLAVIGRLRGTVPAQAASLTDAELLTLLPELCRAAEPAAIPEGLLSPIRLALAVEAPQ